MADKKWHRLWGLAFYLDGPATIHVGPNHEEVVLVWPDGEITKATWDNDKDDWNLSDLIEMPKEYMEKQ
jgi:hypothetical protein